MPENLNNYVYEFNKRIKTSDASGAYKIFQEHKDLVKRLTHVNLYYVIKLFSHKVMLNELKDIVDSTKGLDLKFSRTKRGAERVWNTTYSKLLKAIIENDKEKE